ncbi:unnamed protein product, partial [Cladocopium goreaui]
GIISATQQCLAEIQAPILSRLRAQEQAPLLADYLELRILEPGPAYLVQLQVEVEVFLVHQHPLQPLQPQVCLEQALRPQGQTCLVVHLQAQTRAASLVEVEVAERQAPEGCLEAPLHPQAFSERLAAAVQGAVSSVLHQAVEPQVRPAVSLVLQLEELAPGVEAYLEHRV